MGDSFTKIDLLDRPWFIKYRPEGLHEIIATDVAESLNKSLELDPNIIIVKGQPGSGKTLSVKLLTNWLVNNNIRRKGTIYKNIRHFYSNEFGGITSCENMIEELKQEISANNSDDNGYILIFDEAELLTKAEQAYLFTNTDSLVNSLPNNTLVFILLRYSDDLITLNNGILRDKYTINIHNINSEDKKEILTQYLRDIVANEKASVTEEEISELIEAYTKNKLTIREMLIKLEETAKSKINRDRFKYD